MLAEEASPALTKAVVAAAAAKMGMPEEEYLRHRERVEAGTEEAYPIGLDDRFWSKVDRSGGPGACWPWTAGRHERGYGLFAVPSGKSGGKSRRAHRLALESRLGYRLLPSEVARHEVCNNPPCCNPCHLSPGSVLDNRADCVKAGRQARGEIAAAHKLTADLARAIRSRARAGESPTALGREFGVRKYVIQKIRDGKSWGHV